LKRTNLRLYVQNQLSPPARGRGLKRTL